MFIVHSTFEIPVIEKVDEVIQIYKNRSKLVDQAEGFLHFQLLQNQKKPNFLTVQISWESKEHYMKWVTSEDFKRIHELEKKYPDQELAQIVPKVEQFEVVAT
ncbi:antibiotic biosynthesis monooxygenase family protein [Bacillus pinisoli]|uniref:antibiotic biosynthesis monooxygenase family protein n=1 Tax=Bacillus pinisoli TaxID=2901866 RepID=UPI001FF1F768|nr:antibiotic biosynthesis monooxygenase family protein [Bacillus pinisoli]